MFVSYKHIFVSFWPMNIFMFPIVKKVEKSNCTDNDLYILHVKRYGIRTYSGLVR
jgi:hypothetical protein